MFYKKDVLKNFAEFTRKHLRQSLFFNNVAETLVQVFSREFLKIRFYKDLRKSAYKANYLNYS